MPDRVNPKRPGLLGGVLFGEMKFVLSNVLSSEEVFHMKAEMFS
jgi:hypothetical protein